MRTTISKFVMGAIVAVCALQLGVGAALAVKPEGAGKKSDTNLPKGIQNKIDNGGLSSLRGHWRDVCSGSATLCGTKVTELDGEPVDTNEAGQIICPSTLDDEQMRLCLGLKPVKKVVRVKKLNVQLGEAQ